MLIINKNELFVRFTSKVTLNVWPVYWFGSFHTCQTNSIWLEVP